MKIFKTKRMIFAVTALFIIALIPFIQSCSNNNELEGTEKIESSVELTASEKIDIINSKEFAEYTEASIEIASILKKLDSTSKSGKSNKMGIAPNGVKYKTYPFVVDNILFDVARVKGDALHKKFPTLSKISRTEMKGLITETIQKSKSIRQLIIAKGLIVKTQNVRRKIGINEGNGLFSFTDSDEAILAAMVFSGFMQVECSGYAFKNGSGVLYISPNATHSGSSYPQPTNLNNIGGVDITFYNGQEIESTFHTHFNSQLYSSEGTNGIGAANDLSVQSQYYPNCNLLILYNYNVYEYQFESGLQLSISQ